MEVPVPSSLKRRTEEVIHDLLPKKSKKRYNVEYKKTCSWLETENVERGTIVHRDLATRNVLLAADYICKVSDFGLSRDMYIDETYMMSKKGKVPVKWLALESLTDRVYSSKSDVWSYGVLLWELLTLGATPYPCVAGQDMVHLLREGTRLDQPPRCTDILYKLMCDCWLEDPNERPTFLQICERLEHLEQETVILPPEPDKMLVMNRGYELTGNLLDDN